MSKSRGTPRQDHTAGPGGHSPFAGLALEPLPPGPAVIPPVVPEVLASRHAPKRERLVLRREKAGRGGKTVVVISGFLPGRPAAFFDELAGRLRKACGCGGTVRGSEVEIQGDQAPRVRQVLEADGYRVVGP
jgi:translation initiation factor 1